MEISGRCHCGNISFVLTLVARASDIPARACTCSFCRKHGGVWTSSPTGSLRVVIGDPARVNRYAFGTRTAQFHICTGCGVVPVVTSEIDGRTYAVVNVNAFEDVDPSILRRTSSSFDGEGEGERLARRARNWIPEVRLEAGGA